MHVLQARWARCKHGLAGLALSCSLSASSLPPSLCLSVILSLSLQEHVNVQRVVLGLLASTSTFLMHTIIEHDPHTHSSFRWAGKCSPKPTACLHHIARPRQKQMTPHACDLPGELPPAFSPPLLRRTAESSATALRPGTRHAAAATTTAVALPQGGAVTLLGHETLLGHQPVYHHHRRIFGLCTRSKTTAALLLSRNGFGESFLGTKHAQQARIIYSF